jgi:hypothetical protein
MRPCGVERRRTDAPSAEMRRFRFWSPGSRRGMIGRGAARLLERGGGCERTRDQQRGGAPVAAALYFQGGTVLLATSSIGPKLGLNETGDIGRGLSCYDQVVWFSYRPRARPRFSGRAFFLDDDPLALRPERAPALASSARQAGRDSTAGPRTSTPSTTGAAGARRTTTRSCSMALRPSDESGLVPERGDRGAATASRRLPQDDDAAPRPRAVRQRSVAETRASGRMKSREAIWRRIWALARRGGSRRRFQGAPRGEMGRTIDVAPGRGARGGGASGGRRPAHSPRRCCSRPTSAAAASRRPTTASAGAM